MDLDSKPDYFLADDNDSGRQETDTPKIRFECCDNQPETPETPQPPHRRSHRMKRMFWWSVVIILFVLGIGFWIRYINPYETDMHETGYVVDFKRQGVIFKTWEGQMVVQSSLVDTTRTYSRDFSFSVDDDALAGRMSAMKDTGVPVKVTYKRYWGMLPWRGASTCIVTSAVPER